MGDTAYRLFLGIRTGLLHPDTLLLQLQNRMNERGYKVRLSSVQDLKTLETAAEQAAIELIPTLTQTQPPAAADIATLL